MSGKTVLLQTVAALQLAAQMGFFVPARRFETAVYGRLCCVAGPPDEEKAGLGSFGREVSALVEALRPAGKRTLLFLDEFARSTGSVEAGALLAGLIERLCAEGGVRALLATHCAGLPRLAGASFHRMKGLDRRKFEAASRGAGRAVDERVKLLHRSSDYRLVADAGGARGGDALYIAGVLGLGSDIIRAAGRRLEACAPSRRGRPKAKGRK